MAITKIVAESITDDTITAAQMHSNSTAQFK